MTEYDFPESLQVLKSKEIRLRNSSLTRNRFGHET